MLHIGRKRAGLVKKDPGNKIDADHKEGYVRSEYEAMYIMIKRVARPSYANRVSNLPLRVVRSLFN